MIEAFMGGFFATMGVMAAITAVMAGMLIAGYIELWLDDRANKKLPDRPEDR